MQMVLVYYNGKIFATKKSANSPSIAFLKKEYHSFISGVNILQKEEDFV